MCVCARFSVVSSAGRALHLATLAQEAERGVSELRSQVRSAGPGEPEAAQRERQLKAWEWRLRLFRRMLTGFQHASKDGGRPPLFIFSSRCYFHDLHTRMQSVCHSMTRFVAG